MSIWITLFLIVNITCAAALVYLIISISPHNTIATARGMTAFALVLILWLVSLSNQITMTVYSTQLIFWHRLSESVFLFLPLVLIFLVDHYATHQRMIKKWMYALFYLITASLLVLIWTNQHHFLYWRTEQVISSGGIPHLVIDKTAGLIILNLLQHLIITLSAFHFLHLVLQMSSYYRKQIRLTSASLVLAVIGTLIALARPFNLTLNILPVALTPMCFTLALFIIEYKIFDLLPAARFSYFNQLGDGAIVISRQGNIIDVNKAIHDKLGAETTRKIIGQDILTYFPHWKDKIHEALTTLSEQTTNYIHIRGEETAQYDVVIHPNVDQFGLVTSILIKLQDVTFYRQLLDQVNELAIRDPLTGILNRRHFELLVHDHLKLAFRYQRPACLVMFDLDNFKEINDMYGHQCGDLALTEFTTAITGLLRESDVFARYGGDEFLVFLPETNIAGAITVTEHMREFMFGKTIPVDEKAVTLKCSVGIAAISPSRLNYEYEQLVLHADQAMYGSKAQPFPSIGIKEGDNLRFHELPRQPVQQH